jgi:hypothetical protein
MRFLIAAVVLALALAPVAGAEFGPPLASVPSTLKTQPVVYLKTCLLYTKPSPRDA